jgi:flagellar biosynthetic protein FliR
MINIADFILLLLVFLRISSAIIVAPFLGSRGIPVTIKLFLSLVISYIIYLTLDKNLFPPIEANWILFVFAVKEIIAGLIMGFMLQFVFFAVNYAGTLIGFDMMLNMAEVFNPNEDVQSNIIGEMLYYGALMIFILINGHHYLIQSLNYSYKVIPVGSFTISESLHLYLVKLTASVFVLAVKIASPILVSFFLVHIAEGIIARMIPQMQVFFVTQPLKLGLGIFLILLTLPLYIYMIKNLLVEYEKRLYILISTMGA